MHDISANNMGHIWISTLIGDHYCTWCLNNAIFVTAIMCKFSMKR